MIYILGATILWGGSSAILAQFGDGVATGAPLIAAGGATFLVGLRLTGKGTKVRGALPTEMRFAVLRLGLLEGLNLALYAAALSLGSTPVVISLHLASPILLVAWRVVTRQQVLDVFVLSQVILIVAAISLLSSQAGEDDGRYPLLAAFLALGSAAAVAMLIATVARVAPSTDASFAAAIPLGIAAVSTAPLLIINPPAAMSAAVLYGAGLLLLGPGFYLYWIALRSLSPTAAAVLGLNEAVVASILSHVIFDQHISERELASGALVLGSVGLAVLSRGKRSPTLCKRNEPPTLD